MSNSAYQNNWISCDGGPLILLEEKFLSIWEGSDTPSKVVSSKQIIVGVLDVATDYDRACVIDDWIGLINVGEGKALVLGGDETATTWLPLNEENEGMLIRWICANSKVEAIDAAKSSSDKLGIGRELDFSVDNSDLVLFAAYEAGNDSEIYSRLKISLSSGKYKISTIQYNDEQTSLICHRFRKQD